VIDYCGVPREGGTDSSKAYDSSLIKRLISKKYTGGGVRDHILRMSNVTARLKSLI
jgi:hypothetical protein